MFQYILLFVLERSTRVVSEVFKLTTNFESTVPERMSTVSVSRKLDMSIKGSTVNQKVFSVSSVVLKFEYNSDERYFFNSAFSNTKET